MYRLITLTSTLILLLITLNVTADSVFHSMVSDLNPPYYCKLKLKAARGVPFDPKHNYEFNGICTVRIPAGNTIITQDLWVEIAAQWDRETNTATEQTNIVGGDGNRGSIQVVLRCQDDPWLSKSPCVLDSMVNNTNFSNFGKVYNPRNGLYSPFVIFTGQYPPLARNQAIYQEALVLSIATAQREIAMAQQSFSQAFPYRAPEPRLLPKRTFKKPVFRGYRVDCCLRMNKYCGKPAADAWCRSQGYRRSSNCKIDPNKCSPTYLFGTQSICTQPFCKGFDEVECE